MFQSIGTLAGKRIQPPGLPILNNRYHVMVEHDPVFGSSTLSHRRKHAGF
jgi:hypothetical protein